MRLIITNNFENTKKKHSLTESEDICLLTNFADKFSYSQKNIFIPAEFLSGPDFDLIKTQVKQYLTGLQTGKYSQKNSIFNVLYFEIALFLNEYFSSLRCLDNLFQQYDISEILLDNDFLVPMNEGEYQNSVFYSIAEIYAINYKCKYSKREDNKLKKRLYALHWTQRILVFLSPLLSKVLLRKLHRVKHAALGILFSYDFGRHQDFLRNYNAYLLQHNLNPINLSLTKSFKSIFLNYYILLKIKIGQVLRMPFASDANPGFIIDKSDKLMELLFSEPLKYQWDNYIEKYLHIEKYFNCFGRNLRKENSIDVLYTFTPFEKIYYSLYHFKKDNDNIKLHLLPHSSFINRNFGQYNIFDKVFVWGQAQKEYLVNQNIAANKIIILGNEKYKIISVSEDERRDIQKKAEIGCDKLIISLITYPINSYGGVFEPYSCLDISKYIENLKLILTIPFDKLGFRLVIKSHPRYDFHDYYNSKCSEYVLHRNNINIADLSKISDVVISIGFPSTAIYEMLNPPKPFIYVNCGLDKEYLNQVEKLGVVAEDAASISGIIKELEDPFVYKQRTEKIKDGFKYCFNI